MLTNHSLTMSVVAGCYPALFPAETLPSAAQWLRNKKEVSNLAVGVCVQ